MENFFYNSNIPLCIPYVCLPRVYIMGELIEMMSLDYHNRIDELISLANCHLLKDRENQALEYLWRCNTFFNAEYDSDDKEKMVEYLQRAKLACVHLRETVKRYINEGGHRLADYVNSDELRELRELGGDWFADTVSQYTPETLKSEWVDTLEKNIDRAE